MDFEKSIQAHYLEGHKRYLRHISVDCVIFGFHNNELKVLLLNALYAGKWALPGGFVLRSEHIDTAAMRILRERTGLQEIFMEQFHVFGNPQRSKGRPNTSFLKSAAVSAKDSWMFDRFITIGYTALVDFSRAQPKADLFSSACEWFNIHEMPDLMMDHNSICLKALQHLRMQLSYHPVGYNLLPKKFTMPELQTVYETILDKKLDRRNFQRKILATGILIRSDETKQGVAHKAAYYYTFDKKKYKAAEDGIASFTF